MLTCFSLVWLFATPWAVAHQAPLSIGFSRQEYWRGLPCPPPGALTNPGIKPMSFMSPALEDGFFTTRATWEAHFHLKVKVAQACPTLCDPMDYTVHGILQARILEWVDFPFPGDLPNPRIEPWSPALQADSLLAEPPEKLNLLVFQD